ncbi:MAG TPA: FtsX-like permease family protein [Pyrinomonadaceae bacterium]|jgi:ABC-type antimicrobial peptide transport system permease subunit
MRTATLLRHNFTYYWRTNLAVVVGVATAVAVLAGALLVGASVRLSLRALFLERLGRADYVVASAGFFREELASDVEGDEGFAAGGFEAACPLVVLEGTLTDAESGRRATGVQVYGVDERFWKFHGREQAEERRPRGFEVLLSESLAAELKTKANDALLLRVEKPSAIPVESLHGRKDDVGSTIRLTMRETLAAGALGEFSIRAQQSAVRAAFVPLALLQKDLEQDGKVNAILVSTKPSPDGRQQQSAATPKTDELQRLLQKRFTLEDLGIKLRRLDERRELALESESALVGEPLARAATATAERLDMRAAPVLSYLANTIRANGAEVPYSLVTAVDAESFERLKATGTTVPSSDSADGSLSSPSADENASRSPDANTSRTLAPIIFNEWAARETGARVGAVVALEYYVWREDGRLRTESAEFRLEGIVPIEGAAADRDLVPEYPGITGAQSLADWNPPFPVELTRVRPRDEDYWYKYRTTPKAFITLEAGQRLWQTRFGRLTSLRVRPHADAPLDAAFETYRKNLRDALNASEMNLAVYPVKAQGLEASRGATDFGEYFLYFSFFLVASALLLASLFFKLGIEQRLREIGILRAVGFPAARIRALFLSEAVVLTLLGSALGLAGAYFYGKLMMLGLRTWWVGAVGTTALTLHVTPSSLLLGATGGIVAALLSVVWTLRSVARHSTRSLLTGSALNIQQTRRNPNAHPYPDPSAETDERLTHTASSSLFASLRSAATRLRNAFSSLRVAVVFGVAGLLVLLAAFVGLVGQVAGFFGGGMLCLVALLCLQAAWLGRSERGLIQGRGWRPVFRLGMRNSTSRPSRSLLCITLIACAAFIIVAVDAFRRDDAAGALEKKSGSGGYPLLAESLLPVVHDPNTTEGREALNLAFQGEEANAFEGATFERFRLRPGDDASCLNLYQPRNPKILAATDAFMRRGRFAFQSSLAETDEERANPWLLLHRTFPDGAIPVIADANSLAYVLHLKVGDVFTLQQTDSAAALRLRFVGALSDSLFQSELLMSEQNFLQHFSTEEGFRFFLIDLPNATQAATVAGALEERLSDYSFDVVTTNERLANFHRVENTFLSTFQMLGALGLVLGTLGLAAVLLRNVLERRRELALLRAFGYQRAHFAVMVLAENALLLFCGLATGTICALLAIAPVVASRGGQLPLASLGALLLAVVVSGLSASLLATAAALRSPLLPALRAE